MPIKYELIIELYRIELTISINKNENTNRQGEREAEKIFIFLSFPSQKGKEQITLSGDRNHKPINYDFVYVDKKAQMTQFNNVTTYCGSRNIGKLTEPR